MKAFLSFLLLLFSCLFVRAQEEELLQQVLAANAPQTLQASFTMIRHSPMLTENLMSEGEVFLQAPDKICWEVQRPFSRRTVLNGTEASPHRFRMPAAKDFILSSRRTDGVVRLELTPRRKDLQRMFAKIEVNVHPGTLLVQEVRLVGNDGDWTTIRFDHIRTDAAIPQERFNP
ncbi:MAG: outer membrane lipoprotein carrier protein LolA [Bacteroidales bacterium]|nr:outer membrane lipoprotein carrier protein LolA [Bacteroidales bacterium]